MLNITPDSFYDGGRYLRVEDAKQQIEKMIAEGVDIIDVGGFSSKPGTTLPTVEEELGRILPVLDVLDTYHMPFSVDTCRSEVVKEILKYKNLRYTNDISGLTDEKILPLISGTGVGYILMHIQGTPETMQQNPHYDDVVSEVYNFLEKKIAVIQAAGVTDIVVDPGFGFGKTIEHNYGLLRNIGRLTELGYPVLAGLSRKSMIWRLLDTTPDDTLTETVALHLFALQNGANILRVHDVKEHVRALKISEIIISSSREEDIFDKWNTLKKQVDRREQKNFYVKEREVWYVHI
ncbi:MAG: dihydropteroate synthase [Candidatus Peribacteria bacterium]|nr:MAG: dihydropteroate synthase [Candidatus Peribacteria bacterium]